MCAFELNNVTTNGTTDTTVRQNYYANDDAFTKAKETTKKTPSIWGETVTVNVTDNNATMRDKQSRDILAKYIGGVSGYKQIMGSALEDAFVKENPDDFKQTGTVVRDGKEYPVYTYNAETSDGKISMPTLQKNANGEEFYVMGEASYNADGTATKAKFIGQEDCYQNGRRYSIYQYPDGRTKEIENGVYDWHMWENYNN